MLSCLVQKGQLELFSDEEKMKPTGWCWSVCFSSSGSRLDVEGPD